MRNNDERLSGDFELNCGSVRATFCYDAYPDEVIVDEIAWVKDCNGITHAKKTDRVLAHLDMTSNLLEELIAESVGY